MKITIAPIGYYADRITPELIIFLKQKIEKYYPEIQDAVEFIEKHEAAMIQIFHWDMGEDAPRAFDGSCTYWFHIDKAVSIRYMVGSFIEHPELDGLNIKNTGDIADEQLIAEFKVKE